MSQETKIVHRGITAIVTYDELSGLYYGKLDVVRDNFFFNNEDEPLYDAFVKAVDTYLKIENN